jgi:hypothetical protein
MRNAVIGRSSNGPFTPSRLEPSCSIFDKVAGLDPVDADRTAVQLEPLSNTIGESPGGRLGWDDQHPKAGALEPKTGEVQRRHHVHHVHHGNLFVLTAAIGPASGSGSSSVTTQGRSAATTAAGTLLLSANAKFTCTLNPVTDAITGAYASGAEIGWAGNYQGVATCLGRRFYVQDGFDKALGFGI